jgi:drug/metabolite transporter (DMT)-like permease
MPEDRQIVAKATGLIVLSSCSFGSLSTLTVLITHSGLPLLSAMFWRYLLAGLFLIAFIRRGLGKGISRQAALRLMLVGGVGQAVITYLSLRALDYLPVGPLAFLFYTYPAWVALISAVLGREDLTLMRFTALSIAMTGIVVMVGAPSSASLNPVGIALALGTALLYAIYLPALQRVQQNIPTNIAAFYLIAGVFISFLIASAFARKLYLPTTTEMWGYLVLLSLVCTVFAFGTLIAGLRVLGPVRTSIVATIEPFFTAMLGIVLLGEAMTRGTVVGGALIAGAVLLLQVTGRPKASEALADSGT